MKAGAYQRLRLGACLLAVTLAAILVHGYHPGVEDAEIYLPGIKKVLDPSLYPQNAQFFASHASRTMFPNLIAASTRVLHLPLEYVLLLWHAFSIFMLLWACWQIGKLCFDSETAAWGGAILVAALLTIPVAGTALYILDEYLNPRSLSTFMILFAVLRAAEGKYIRAGLWTLGTAFIHPLMVVFGLTYLAILLGLGRRGRVATAGLLLLAIPDPASNAYLEALHSRSYFYVTRWAWYEWLGAIAPLALLWWYRKLAQRHGWAVMERLSTALVAFGLLFIAAGFAVELPAGSARLLLSQPMRAFHLIYVLFFVMSGGLAALFFLKGQVWRWFLLFVPLCGGMFYVQRQLFPASPHMEWPGVTPQNDWLKAFAWVRQNTPKDALFALDPEYMELAGADEHGFRALAERSRLADNIKDTGAVTMFPKMAADWEAQVQALAGWRTFHRADFDRLRRFGVNWVLVSQTQRADLDCPYQNKSLAVCRLD